MTFVVDYLYPKQGQMIHSKDYTGSRRKGILPMGYGKAG